MALCCDPNRSTYQLCGPRYWLSSTAGVHKHICPECYAEKLFPDDVSTASFKLIVDPIVAEAGYCLQSQINPMSKTCFALTASRTY